MTIRSDFFFTPCQHGCESMKGYSLVSPVNKPLKKHHPKEKKWFFFLFSFNRLFNCIQLYVNVLLRCDMQTCIASIVVRHLTHLCVVCIVFRLLKFLQMLNYVHDRVTLSRPKQATLVSAIRAPLCSCSRACVRATCVPRAFAPRTQFEQRTHARRDGESYR